MSYQTVKLEAGPHNEGEGKACVMEIVSMLAHEEFTDSPLCTCPIIGGVLQGINDCATDADRQTLWPYTTRVVNTNDGKHLERLHKLELEVRPYDTPLNAYWFDAAETWKESASHLSYVRISAIYAFVLNRMKGWDYALTFLDSLLPETEEIPAEELIAVKRELAAA